MKSRLKARNFFLLMGIISIFIIYGFASCATKAKFVPSTIVPAAEGRVLIKKDKNKNNYIKIQVVNLAQPDRLDPPKKAYVVWMVTTEERTKNIGQIRTSTSLLSKSLKASFETVTPLRPQRIFITAEDETDADHPGSQVVLTTGEF